MSDRTPGRIVGVYHANGGLAGEIRYLIGKLRGTTQCALCDITHGKSPRLKSSWKKAVRCLPYAVEMVHLNEMDPRTARLVDKAHSPAVVFLPDGDDEGGLVLLDSKALESCHGDPEKLSRKILEALGADEM